MNSTKPSSGVHDDETTVPSITAITCWLPAVASVVPYRLSIGLNFSVTTPLTGV